MEDELHLTYTSGQKIVDIEKTNQFSLSYKKNQKINNIEIISSIITIFYAKNIFQKTCISSTIKLNVKPKNAKMFLSSS